MSIPKRIFIASSILLIIILLFWGIYDLSFKKSSPPTAPTGNANQAASPVIPQPAKAGQIAAISDEAVLAPVLAADGQTIKYYSKATGKTYQIDLDGANKKTLSDKELAGLSDVAWSPDRTKVLTKFAAQSGQAKFFLYDYAQNIGTPLKSNLDNVIWGSNSKIFYKYYDPKTKERSLNISDPDGTHWFKLADIALRDISIAPIPKTGLVSYWNTADSFTGGNLHSVPIIGGEQKTILSGKFGADYLWSSDGNTLLASYTEEKGGAKMQLATLNSVGGEYKNLGIPTLVSKSVWSKNNKLVYYALPGSIPDGTVMPNDYASGKFTTADTFWKVDVTTGEKSRIVDLDKITGSFDATSLFTNSDESILFFINKIDGKLYRLDI